MRIALLAAALLSAGLLAGCAEDPLAGVLAPTGHALAISGSATVTYTPFNSGGNPGNTVPVVGGGLQCAQDGVPGLPPESPVQPCTPASTTIALEVHDLPAAGSGQYTLFLNGGQDPARKVADLTVDESGHAVVNATIPEDLTGRYSDLEIRLDDFLYAKAPASGGQVAFTISAPALTVDATFSGPVLTVTVQGLPEGASYTGRLYTAEGAAQTPPSAAESFPITNGETAYSAKADIGSFAEFHIHVADSKINLHKQTVQVQAAE